MQLVYLNGKFIPISEATVSVLDRGFLFGDGVYEVVPVYHGKPFRLDEHLARLQHSLQAILLPEKVANEQIKAAILELLQKNNITVGDHSIYIQITRGAAAERDFHFSSSLEPTIFIAHKAVQSLSFTELQRGKNAITLEDIRWKYCHIKSISLLPSILLYQQVYAQNCYEGILLRDGYAIEGISSNIFIVKNNTIITPPLSAENLSGVTRDLILQIMQQNNIQYREQSITAEQLLQADEVWISSSTRGIMPITSLNAKVVNSGKAGPVWECVAKLYLKFRDSLQNKGAE